MMRLALSLAALNVVDILATKAEIARYGENVEANPVAFASLSGGTLWTIKLALCALVALAVWRFRPRAATPWLRFAVGAFALLAVWHLFILLT